MHYESVTVDSKFGIPRQSLSVKVIKECITCSKSNRPFSTLYHTVVAVIARLVLIPPSVWEWDSGERSINCSSIFDVLRGRGILSLLSTAAASFGELKVRRETKSDVGTIEFDSNLISGLLSGIFFLMHCATKNVGECSILFNSEQ